MKRREFVKSQGTPSKDYLVYVATNAEDEDSILDRLKSNKDFLVNAIVVQPSDNHSSSLGLRKYKARIVRNGRWINVESLEEGNAVELLSEFRLKPGFLTKYDSADYDQIINEAIILADISDLDDIYDIDDVEIPQDVKRRLILKSGVDRAIEVGSVFKKVFAEDKKKAEDLLTKEKGQAAEALAKRKREWDADLEAALLSGNDIFGIVQEEENKAEKVEKPKLNLPSELDREIIKAASENKSFTFFNSNRLPRPILEGYILRHLNLEQDISTTNSLAELSKITKAGLLFREYIDNKVKPLLQAVVYGQYDEVKRLLEEAEQKSLLLLERLLVTPLEVVDYSGRHVFGTALQLALGAGDVSRPEYLDPPEGMISLISLFYSKLSNGESLKNAQCKEFFENSALTEAQNNKDIDAVEMVFKRIINAKRGSDCERELDAFRKYLEPNSENLITGKHFNYNMLIRAYELSIAHYDRLGGDGSQKNLIVFHKVIGYLQRFLPANYMQIVIQDHDCKPEMGSSKRLLSREGTLDFMFPLPTGTSGLGYNKGMLNGHLTEESLGCFCLKNELVFFNNLCQQKTAMLHKIEDQVKRSDHPSKRAKLSRP